MSRTETGHSKTQYSRPRIVYFITWCSRDVLEIFEYQKDRNKAKDERKEKRKKEEGRERKEIARKKNVHTFCTISFSLLLITNFLIITKTPLRPTLTTKTPQ